MTRLAPIGLVAVACLLVFLAAWGIDLRSQSRPVAVVLHMAVDTAGGGQVFTFRPEGYSEEYSTRFALEHGGHVLAYAIELDAPVPLERIRVDPGVSEGTLRIERLELAWRRTSLRLEGDALQRAVTPLHHLELVHGDRSGQGVSMRSTGGDPYFEVQLPRGLADSMRRVELMGGGFVVIGCVGLLLLAWRARRTLAALFRRAAGGGWPWLPLAALAGFGLLDALGVGCNGLCSPRGVGYGGLLFMAALAFAVIGLAVLRVLGMERDSGRPRLFLALLAGQAVLVLYVALRSVIHAWLPWVPLTGPELMLLVLVALAWVLHDTRRRGRFPSPESARGRWPLIELALLAVVCIVIGERELPRLVMLSSDPDTHAYFAQQLERGGGIPWSGDARFHYPAGTAVLGFLWAKLAFLDVRNAVTALPLLQTFLAGLVLAEAFARHMREPCLVLILFLAALGVTAAAFLVPLYSQYAHMEGAGRQMAIASLAMILAVALSPGGSPHRRGAAVLVLLALFVLALLNPINVVVPLVLLAGHGVHQLVRGEGFGHWVLVPPALVLLLLLDPYYMALILGSGTSESRVTMDPALPVNTLLQTLERWAPELAQGPVEFFRGNAGYLPGQAPLFILFATVLTALLACLRPCPLRSLLRKGLACGVALSGLWAADALFDALIDDRRFYLLAPYYWLSLAQLKMLLVTGLLSAAILAARRRRLPWPLIGAFAGLAIAASFFAMHGTQQFMERPRVEYCGSLGCVEEEDLAVLEAYEALAQSGQLKPGRILLPNSRHEAHREKWVFPVAGARALPFFDVPQAAFYYYQGDPDFTTANYVNHVCERFDREWLREQKVAYVFLPARRGDACLAGMESLPETDRVLLRHGDSMIVELK